MEGSGHHHRCFTIAALSQSSKIHSSRRIPSLVWLTLIVLGDPQACNTCWRFIPTITRLLWMCFSNVGSSSWGKNRQPSIKTKNSTKQA